MKLVNAVILLICVTSIVGCGSSVAPPRTLGSDKTASPDEAPGSDRVLGSEKEEGSLSVGMLVADKYVLSNARICDPSGCYIAWRVVDSDRDGVSDADEVMAGTDPYDAKSRPGLVVVAELRGKEQLPSFEAGLGAFVVFPPELQAMIQKTRDDPLGDIMVAFPLTKERVDTLTRLGISSELMKEHGVDVTSDGLTVGPLVKPKESGVLEPRIGGVEIRLISADDDPAPLDPKAGQHGAAGEPVELGDGTKFITYADGTMRWEHPDGGGVVMNKDGDVIGTWYVNPDAEQVSEVPTPEQEEAFKRLRGATILTVNNWYDGPEIGDEEFGDPYETIILLDPEYAYNTAMIFSSPVVNDAQPEVRPDLPNPGVPANPGGIPGDCTVGCE